MGKGLRVTVVGGGYVGLPLSIAIVEGLHGVNPHVDHLTIYDVDDDRVDAINEGTSHVTDVTDDRLSSLVNARMISATDTPPRRSDVVVVCVPTPLQNSKEPDLTHVMRALHTIKQSTTPPYLLLLESTVSPGFTREVVEPLFADVDVRVAFSPERVNPAGSPAFTITNTPKVVGANTDEAMESALSFYSSFVQEVVPASSTDVAELAKLLENIFRSVNIALVNEFAQGCQAFDVDVWDVIEAAATKPFGFMAFRPGPGVGGHCIGPDPRYYTSKMRTLRRHSRLIETAADINESMPQHVVNWVTAEMSRRGLPLANANVLIVGVAYKRDVSDCRESPAIDIIRGLVELGAVVSYYDPHVESITYNGEVYLSIDHERLRSETYSASVVVTDHTLTPYEDIINSSSVVFDTRDAIRSTNYWIEDEKVVVL